MSSQSCLDVPQALQYPLLGFIGPYLYTYVSDSNGGFAGLGSTCLVLELVRGVLASAALCPCSRVQFGGISWSLVLRETRRMAVLCAPLSGGFDTGGIQSDVPATEYGAMPRGSITLCSGSPAALRFLRLHSTNRAPRSTTMATPTTAPMIPPMGVLFVIVRGFVGVLAKGVTL